MKLLVRGFALASLVLSATQDLSAMCLATPCYLLQISIGSAVVSEGSGTCLLDGTLLSSKQVECSGVDSYRTFDPSTLSLKSSVPETVKFPLKLNEDRKVCKSLDTEREEVLLYAFQDCCDTPGRSCIRGYQVKIARPRG